MELMKASELRIGNYVQGTKLSIPRLGIESDGIYQISGYGIYLLESGSLAYEPIPLTEEWFEKFNATKDKEFNMHYTLPINGDYGYMLFLKDGDEYDVFIHVDEDSILLYNSIKFVHQLQNIYFAISGEELILK